MEILLQNLTALTRLRPRELEPILPFFQKVKYSARAILLQPGDISQTAWFVGTGILRAYFVIENARRGAYRVTIRCQQ